MLAARPIRNIFLEFQNFSSLQFILIREGKERLTELFQNFSSLQFIWKEKGYKLLYKVFQNFSSLQFMVNTNNKKGVNL